MSVTLRRQRDGKLRPYWYGEYVESDGKRKVLNLGEWRGTPPAALTGKGKSTTGDAEFEASRKEAETALKGHAEEAGRKGRAEHLTERLIESKTGRAVQYSQITDLSKRWRNLGRESAVSEDYLKGCDAVFNRFAAFMQIRNPSARHLYEVTPEDAAAHVSGLQKGTKGQPGLARKTVRDAVKLLNKSFERFLPVGSANPFAGFVGRRSNGESETVHRKPFTPEELRALLDAARDDAFMFPLITLAACSGMRRGDVCGLRWNAVDLAAGMLTVKTSKTGAEVEIPIFKPLRAVLESRKGRGKEYVFPEAAQMLADNPDGLTWRFKKLVTEAFNHDEPPALPPVTISPDEAKAAGMAAIAEKMPEGKRRERMLENFRRYMAGESVRAIVRATGLNKATVSNDLHHIEEWTGKPFLRVQAPSVKKAVRLATQVTREQGHGQRAASVRDWHALRATFVTLALSAGVPVELVRRVTGHATVEVVLKHYFRPGREQFRAALAGAMPDVLTGKRTRLNPADELAAITGKLAAGTATDEDKARFRKLAAKV